MRVRVKAREEEGAEGRSKRRREKVKEKVSMNILKSPETHQRASTNLPRVV